MDLTIEAPHTVISAEADRLRLNCMNTGPDFSLVTFLTAKSLDELSELIRYGVGRYGIDSTSAEDWIESVSAKPDQKSDFAITPGTSTGLQITYDLRYDGSKDTQVIIVDINPLPSKSRPQVRVGRYCGTLDRKLSRARAGHM
jgi:hypothetical protein